RVLGELALLEVVVDHHVCERGVVAGRGGLAAVRRGVAVDAGAPELLQVDVGPVEAAAQAAVALRRLPAELPVLDRVDVLRDPGHGLDPVGDPVAVRVGQVGGVGTGGDPVDAEVTSGRAVGGVRRLGDAV